MPFLQGAVYNFIETETYEPYFASESKKSSSTSSIDSPSSEIKLKTHISKEVALSVSNLLLIMSELFNSFPSGIRTAQQSDIAHRHMVISDSLVGLHDTNVNLAHLTKVMAFLEPRETEPLYDATDPSAFLKGMTHFKMLDQNKIEKNDLNSFIFRNTLLKLIQNVLNRDPSDISYQYFKEVLGDQLFNYLNGKLFRGGAFQACVVDKSAGIDETLLVETLDKAIEKLFGYTTTLFLKQGLVSFSRGDLNNYVIEFVAHNYHDLFRFASEFQIRSLVRGETKATMHLGSFASSRYEREFISMILSGNQERLTTVDLNGNLNIDLIFQKSTPRNSPFLTGLFDNIIEGSSSIYYHQKIRDIFISWFYQHFDSDLKIHQLFIDGREVMGARITEMLEDQVSLDTIKLFFKDEIDAIFNFADSGITWLECARVKRLQVIQFMTRIYIQALYFPRQPLSKSQIASGMKNIGDIANIMRHLLLDPLLDTTFLPFALSGMYQFDNDFFNSFYLTFSLNKFSLEDLNLVIPTLGYTYNSLPSERGRFKGDNSYLYDLMAILPELSEQVQKLYKNFKFYFSDYIGATGVKDFTVRFYLSEARGFHKTQSLLKNAISSSFRKDSSGQLIDELKGEFLEFIIDSNTDLEVMVANIIFYMLKYKCVAAINEGNAGRFDYNDPNTKYVLIASPGRLYNSNFFLSSGSDLENIKNDGLSAKAVELYKNLFGIDQSDLYEENYYSSIWDRSFIYAPYLMRNSHLFNQYFSTLLGVRNNIIVDLMNF